MPRDAIQPLQLRPPDDYEDTDVSRILNPSSDAPAADAWPEPMDDAAYFGLAGEIEEALEFGNHVELHEAVHAQIQQ